MHDTGEEREGMESSVEAGGMAARQVVIQGNKDAGRWRGRVRKFSLLPLLLL